MVGFLSFILGIVITVRFYDFLLGFATGYCEEYRIACEQLIEKIKKEELLNG